jgi:release factor glutamine methyltransferase
VSHGAAENAVGLLARVRAVVEPAWTPLADKPEESLDRTVRALWFAAADAPRAVERCDDGDLPALDSAAAARVLELARQRAEGTPLAHLTCRQSFFGLEMLSGPGALIPRHETELLARTALSRLPARADEDRPLSVVDVCTGSGNVALAMAAADSRIRVLGIDISEEAIELADANARHLDLAGRARFLVRDLFAGLDEQVDRHSLDLITCNPPYITSANLAHLPSETRDHEPRLAFDGGAFGLDVISRVVAESPHWLRPGAALCFEVGAANGKFFAGRVGRNDRYESVEPIANEEGVVRVIVATTRA